MRAFFSITWVTVLAGCLALSATLVCRADDKARIDANTERALAWLRSSGETAKLLDRAAGVLVFPDVVKMGFGVGGEFGEGTLVVDGKTVDYYAAAGKSFGLGPDAEFKAEVILFMTDDALHAFRDSSSWKVGEHATVPVMNHGAAIKSSEPMVGLIFSEDGLASDLNLDGVHVTRISRQ